MKEEYRGKAWVFGDHIIADTAFAFSEENKYLSDLGKLARYCMVGYDPDFPSKVKPGDIIVAGCDFGCGHAHPQFPQSIKGAGVDIVIAESFGRDMFRNFVNIGYPIPIICPGVKNKVRSGDLLRIDLKSAVIHNESQKTQIEIQPIPEEIMLRIEAGGMINYLRQHLKSKVD
jgi:3-isopropylmalate dehydratase small subunit